MEIPNLRAILGGNFNKDKISGIILGGRGLCGEKTTVVLDLGLFSCVLDSL